MAAVLEPLGDKIIIEPIETSSVSKGGILLPDAARERTQRGVVIAAGPGRIGPIGDTIAISVSPGDEVIYAKYGGSEIKIDDVTYIILSERDIHCRVKADG